MISTDYERVCYYSDPDVPMSGTMQWLHWFRFFVRNADLCMRAPGPESQEQWPTKTVRLFFVMRSTEATHLPCVYTAMAPRPLTYQQWLARVFELPIEREVNKVLRKEVRSDIRWQLYEFVGWTSDGLIQNPEENKQAFRFAGHLVKSIRQVRDKADD